jgi:RNA polymerase sigma-70 factor (ECF subfamily)
LGLGVEPEGMAALCPFRYAMAVAGLPGRAKAVTREASPMNDRGHESGGDAWGALMVAAQGGHPDAYRQLLGELRAWLVRYFARRLPMAQVEDVVQETLIAVHEKRHTYDPRRPFRPWLAAVARYKWIDRLRAMGRERSEALPEDIGVIGHEGAVTSAILLGRLLTTLKPAQANAIRLVKLQGYSIEEASQQTGQSPSLVKVNIHRGLARLAAVIERHSDVD